MSIREGFLKRKPFYPEKGDKGEGDGGEGGGGIPRCVLFFLFIF